MRSKLSIKLKKTHNLNNLIENPCAIEFLIKPYLHNICCMNCQWHQEEEIDKDAGSQEKTGTVLNTLTI